MKIDVLNLLSSIHKDFCVLTASWPFERPVVFASPSFALEILVIALVFVPHASSQDPK